MMLMVLFVIRVHFDNPVVKDSRIKLQTLVKRGTEPHDRKMRIFLIESKFQTRVHVALQKFS